MVSIILTTLNGASTLNHLLESINKQTYTNIEVILIDAGSKDNTVQIFNEFIFNNTIKKTYINNENEINIVDSYRTGFNASSGQYIITIGHDDFFYDIKWLEISVEILSNNKDIGLVWGRSLILDSNLNAIEINPKFEEKIFDLQNTFAQVLATNRIPTDVNCIIKRNIFDLCFPNINDGDCYIFTPHHYFYLKFFELNYYGKFLEKIATCSVNPANDFNRRQGKFTIRETKCSKSFRQKMQLSTILFFLNFNHIRLPKISQFHFKKGKFYFFYTVILILFDFYLYKYSISRIFRTKIIKKFS